VHPDAPQQSIDPVLLLMGLRGSGKSTIGRELARRQQRAFIDLDDRTCALLGVASASEAFATLGQSAYRDAETKALKAALDQSGAIIALGGGTPTAPGAADLIRAAAAAGRAVAVYLRCTPAELRARLTGRIDARRPSITGADPLDEIEAVFAQRDPLYQSLAARQITGLTSLEEAIRALDGWRAWNSTP